MQSGSAEAVFDVDAAGFQQKVLEASKHGPVVVDFWADWCMPCRALGPVLEREVAALDGRVSLAKLDVEENRELSASFEIRGIPAVKAFRDGQVVAEFEGMRDPGFVRQWLRGLAPSEAVRKLEAATTQSELRALAGDPEVGPRAVSRLVPQLLAQGQSGEALGLLDSVSAQGELSDELNRLRQLARFSNEAERAGGEAAARAALEKNPGDLDARWALAGARVAAGEWELALAQLLEVVRASRAYRDDGARKMMLTLFEQLGHTDPLTRDYRRRLVVIL